MADSEAPVPDRPDPEPPSAALRWIFDSVPRFAIGTALLVGVAINFVNVITRHFFGFALFWAEEIMVFGIIWSTAVAAIAITFNGEHLRMDLFSSRLPSPWREMADSEAPSTDWRPRCSLACAHSLPISPTPLSPPSPKPVWSASPWRCP